VIDAAPATNRSGWMGLSHFDCTGRKAKSSPLVSPKLLQRFASGNRRCCTGIVARGAFSDGQVHA
jgi:hypothetical protein